MKAPEQDVINHLIDHHNIDVTWAQIHEPVIIERLSIKCAEVAPNRRHVRRARNAR